METVRFWHDGVTKSIFAHLIPAKGVDFSSFEKVVKMIVQDLDMCDNEPSILALLRAVKLAWTGDVVQETSAEGDPQSNGAAESSVNVVKGHVRSIKLAGGISFKCRSASRPLSVDVALCRMQPACTVGLRWVETARQHRNEMWEGALFPLAQFGERVW